MCALSRERLAHTQVLFREVNERVCEMADGASWIPLEFVCECSNEGCTEGVSMTLEQYDRVRAAPTTFVVLPGHEIDEIEVVVSEGEGYFVVERKVAAEMLDRTDPRSDRED